MHRAKISLVKKIIVVATLFSAVEFSASAKEVRSVEVEGNKRVKPAAILRRFPCKVGHDFDSEKISEGIKLVDSMGYFSQVSVESETTDDGQMDLFVVVKERPLLASVELHGNKALSTKKISEKVSLSSLKSIDLDVAKLLVFKIKRLYKESDFHSAKASYKISKVKGKKGVGRLDVFIEEGPKTRVGNIRFVGNKNLADPKIRSRIYSKELWLLSGLDGSGKFDKDMIEADRYQIENLYQDHGYLKAKVTDIKIEPIEDHTDELNITYHIEEGDKYNVRYISVPFDDEYDERQILNNILLKEGKTYSKSLLNASMERLRFMWGHKGHLLADVYPDFKIHADTKEIDIEFKVEKGRQVWINRVDVTGNKATRDKVIRREISVEEGSIAKTAELEVSKRRIEALGYFDRDGVNWKQHQVAEDVIDLEMNVKEKKTGSFMLQGAYGTGPSSGLKLSVQAGKRNLGGHGRDFSGLLEVDTELVRQFRATFFEPFLGDTNVSMGIDSFIKKDKYEQWREAYRTPVERVAGANVEFGFRVPQLDKDVKYLWSIGFEDGEFTGADEIIGTRTAYRYLVDRKLKSGGLFWTGLTAVKDTRNHPVYPSHGYRLELGGKIAPSFLSNAFSYYKIEADAAWYTPIIGPDKLIFCAHARIGILD
ncbi:outer membrane protein assembly factor BamA, partial [bacterium]|nr:outer membrane protein assembly factor BamA [bacterium]